MLVILGYLSNVVDESGLIEDIGMSRSYAKACYETYGNLRSYQSNREGFPNHYSKCVLN